MDAAKVLVMLVIGTLFIFGVTLLLEHFNDE